MPLLPAISCLGAFRTPAARACRGRVIAGVRKPAQCTIAECADSFELAVYRPGNDGLEIARFAEHRRDAARHILITMAARGSRSRLQAATPAKVRPFPVSTKRMGGRYRPGYSILAEARQFGRGGLCCTDRPLGGEDWTVYQGTVPDPGQPPCHSKRAKIAVITSRSSTE